MEEYRSVLDKPVWQAYIEVPILNLERKGTTNQFWNEHMLSYMRTYTIKKIVYDKHFYLSQHQCQRNDDFKKERKSKPSLLLYKHTLFLMVNTRLRNESAKTNLCCKPKIACKSNSTYDIMLLLRKILTISDWNKPIPQCQHNHTDK